MADFDRHVAYKVTIRDILIGEFVEQPGWEPNYVVFKKRNVSRVNLIGVVIAKPSSEESTFHTIVIDDSTSVIDVRSFDDSNAFGFLSVGDIVQIIGRIRHYGSERYVQAEILSPIHDRMWVELRKKEMIYNNDSSVIKPRADQIQKEPPRDDVLDVIRSFDKGDGANVESLLEQLGPNTESVITQLLEQGNIFETRPGKVKVLE